MAVAASPASAFVATGVSTSGDNDVRVYANGGTLPVRTVQVSRSETVATRGLAWGMDLKRLFLITQDAVDPAPRLTIVTDPTKNDH